MIQTTIPKAQATRGDMSNVPETDRARGVLGAPRSLWLTIREAERYARVSDGTLRAAVKRGEVPAYQRKGGKGAIVSTSDVDDWIRSWDSAAGLFAPTR